MLHDHGQNELANDRSHEHDHSDSIDDHHLGEHTSASRQQAHGHDRAGHAHHDEEIHSHDDHDHEHSILQTLLGFLPGMHGHHHGGVTVDSALEGSERGIWALKVSLLGLGATAVFQLGIAVLSGSAGLLADTIHNFADALTALPLWMAFMLGKRSPNRRYTYGYGRAEDVAGVLILLLMGLSSVVAGYETYRKFRHPQPLNHVWWVIAAALIGFVGNEVVARFRIRIGREIGSAALEADGKHAQADGFTSLAVLLGAAGSLLGFPLADPLIGLLITLAILFVVKDAATTMWERLMDAIDPEVVDQIEQVSSNVTGVHDVQQVRVRWLGHKLQTELHITVDEDLPTRRSHEIAEDVRHQLFHEQPRLAVVNIHIDPCGHSGRDPHDELSHHETVQTAPQ